MSPELAEVLGEVYVPEGLELFDMTGEDIDPHEWSMIVTTELMDRWLRRFEICSGDRSIEIVQLYVRMRELFRVAFFEQVGFSAWFPFTDSIKILEDRGDGPGVLVIYHARDLRFFFEEKV